MILPYIEQVNLYNEAGLGPMANNVPVSTLNVNGGAVIATPIPTVRCPSDVDFAQIIWTDRADVDPTPVAITNYKGVAGANWEWGNALWNPGYAPGAGINGNNQQGLDAGNGVLWRSNGPGASGNIAGGVEYSWTFTSITDGTSNTFMLGEDLPVLSQWCGCWAYANNVTGTVAIYLNANQTAGLGGNLENATNGD